MIFPRRSPIIYPFTAYYHGFINDLGENPRLTVQLFSENDNSIINVDSAVDLKEIRQLSDATLFVGTAIINKEENFLMPGNYRIVISVNGSHNIITLMYLPIEISAKENAFDVAFMNRKNITNDEVKEYMADLVDVGVKSGLEVTRGHDTNSFDVASGVLLTRAGTKITLSRDIKNAFTIQGTGEFPRTDAICVVFDESRYDRFGNVVDPEIRVVKGSNESFGMVPVLPDNHTPIAYISISAGTDLLTPANSSISYLKYTSMLRPFFNIKAREVGDGVLDTFTFDVEYGKGTTKVFVDGVEQRIDEDYVESASGNGIGTIRFIDGVPQEGQIVTLSGQVPNSPYINPGLLPYTSNEGVDIAVDTFSYDGLLQAFSAYNYSTADAIWEGEFQNQLKGVLTCHPRRAFNNPLGYYVYFKHTDRLISSNPVKLSGIAWVITTDLREMPNDGITRRLLTCDFYVIDITNNHQESIISLKIADGTTYAMSVGAGIISASPSVIEVDVFDNNISIKYNNKVKTWAVSEGEMPEGLFTIGCPLNKSIEGLQMCLKSLVIYNRPLNQNEYKSFIGE